MEDPVNHPHYYCLPSGVECIDVITELGLGFEVGNAFAYIWRAKQKGKEQEDLLKAVFYLQRRIAQLAHRAQTIPAVCGFPVPWGPDRLPHPCLLPTGHPGPCCRSRLTP